MSLVSRILNLFFPAKCTFCTCLLEQDKLWICPECQRRLPWLEGAAAEKRIEFTSKCVSVLRYQNRVQESILRYKFAARECYCVTYGVLLSQAVCDHLKGQYDLISWVPVSWQRKRKRGYDQSFLMAREMGKQLGQKPVKLLRKVKHTKAQSSLHEAAARRANAMGVYRAPWPERVQGKRILLVDDVVTTGSTISECARTLLMAGAEDIVCVTLARAG